MGWKIRWQPGSWDSPLTPFLGDPSIPFAALDRLDAAAKTLGWRYPIDVLGRHDSRERLAMILEARR